MVAKLESDMGESLRATGIARRSLEASQARARRAVAKRETLEETDAALQAEAGEPLAALEAAAATAKGRLASVARAARGARPIPPAVEAMLRAAPGFTPADLEDKPPPPPVVPKAPPPPAAAVAAGKSGSAAAEARPAPAAAAIPPPPPLPATAALAARPAAPTVVSVRNLPCQVPPEMHERALRRALGDHRAPQPALVRVLPPYHPADPPEARLEYPTAALADAAARVLDRLQIAPNHWVTAVVQHPSRQQAQPARYQPNAKPGSVARPGGAGAAAGAAAAAAAAAATAAAAAAAAKRKAADAGLQQQQQQQAESSAVAVNGQTRPPSEEQQPLRMDLRKSGAQVARVLVEVDASRRGASLNEPRGWPETLDVAQRADLNHVLGAVAKPGDAVRTQALCRITPEPDEEARAAGRDPEPGRKAFAKFVDYFARKSRAGTIETADGRRIYLIPPGSAVCQRLACAVEPRPCLLALITM